MHRSLAKWMLCLVPHKALYSTFKETGHDDIPACKLLIWFCNCMLTIIVLWNFQRLLSFHHVLTREGCWVFSTCWLLTALDSCWVFSLCWHALEASWVFSTCWQALEASWVFSLEIKISIDYPPYPNLVIRWAQETCLFDMKWSIGNHWSLFVF